MTERRKISRTKLEQYLEVVDAESRSSLGRMVDVTICGFMLLSEAELETGRNYKIAIQMPSEVDGKTEILCGAEARRCSKGSIPKLFEVGFEISDIQPSERYTLEKVILHYERRLKNPA